jgi:hypothetical protein
MKLRENRRRLPLAGAAIVFRHRQRNARPLWVALGVCGLLMATVTLDAVLSAVLFGKHSATAIPGMLRAVLPNALIAQAVILTISAAVFGACAAPVRESEEEVQSALLAGISPIDQCVGRLLATLATPLLALLATCLLWLVAQVVYGFQPQDQGGTPAIAVAHMVLLNSILMVGATGLLFALKRKPGREAWRGITAAILLSATCMGGLFIAGSHIRKIENPVPLINAALLINPVVAAESALHRDVMRWSWIYDRVPAADYEFTYPNPWTACGIFLVITVVALSLSAIRLRSAYR